MQRKTLQRALASLVAASLVLSITSASLARQGGTTRYVYDDNGRLHAVISPTGEGVVYEYDAAGNLTNIRRLAATDFMILDLSPRVGGEGDRVLIVGLGFQPDAAANAVTFNGTPARVVEATANTILAEVPAGATTGPVTVSSAAGNAASPFPFTVRPRVRVTPESALLPPDGSVQFTASLFSLPEGAGVEWSVNGIAGGNAITGTISPDGLYEAPPSAGRHVVRASVVGDSEVFGEASVQISASGGFILTSLTVQRGEPSPSGVGAPHVAVLYRHGPSVIFAQRLSVSFGARPGVVFAPHLTARFGGDAGVIQAPGVSAEFGPRPGRIVAAVSALTGPYVNSFTPSELQRGTTATVTVGGRNLTGATELRFLLPNGQPDSSFTVSDIQASADGTRLTASVVVAATAAPDNRIVTVTTAAGRSPATNLGGNVVRVTQ